LVTNSLKVSDLLRQVTDPQEARVLSASPRFAAHQSGEAAKQDDPLPLAMKKEAGPVPPPEIITEKSSYG